MAKWRLRLGGPSGSKTAGSQCHDEVASSHLFSRCSLPRFRGTVRGLTIMSIRTSKIRGGKTNQTKSIGLCLKSRARYAATIKVPQRIELMSVDRTFRLCAIFFLI
jgi:hypothetical protein